MLRAVIFFTLSSLVVIFGVFVRGEDDAFGRIDKEYFNGGFWSVKRHKVPGDLKFNWAYDVCSALGYDFTKSIGGCMGSKLLSGCVPAREGQSPTVYLSPCPAGWTCHSNKYHTQQEGNCEIIDIRRNNLFDFLNIKWFGTKFWEKERKSTTQQKRYMNAQSVCEAEGYDKVSYLGGCAGTELLSGCHSDTKGATVFRSPCPDGHSCRWTATSSTDTSRGTCTRNPQ